MCIRDSAGPAPITATRSGFASVPSSAIERCSVGGEPPAQPPPRSARERLVQRRLVIEAALEAARVAVDLQLGHGERPGVDDDVPVPRRGELEALRPGGA